MELLFETRGSVGHTLGRLHFRQVKPEILPAPVLVGDSMADACGAMLPGTVLRDGGMYRMWYQAWPKDWDGGEVSLVGYAESDDGVSWRKPRLGLVDYQGTANNLCNLGLQSPSVFIDPSAPGSHRYRATGFAAEKCTGPYASATRSGFYAAHSSDGLNWGLDSSEPVWEARGGNAIASVYHAVQQRAIAAIGCLPRVNGMPRRSISGAELRNGIWGEAKHVLLPDEFDDIGALARGYASGDYLGMGMSPAGKSTVGFLCHFRHRLPYSEETNSAVFGAVDVSLVFQEERGDRWLHAPGRPDFLSHADLPWVAGGVLAASCPVEVGEEHWLYFGGATHPRGWDLDSEGRPVEQRRQQILNEGMGCIGAARWPKDRLFGFEGDPQGEVPIGITGLAEPSELLLNYKAAAGGSVRVKLVTLTGKGDPGVVPGRGEEDAVPLTGDSAGAVAVWKGGTVIEPQLAAQHFLAHILIDRATVYAYELRPTR